MSFDLYAQQGKWREWNKFFDKIFADRKDEDFSKKTALDIGCAVGFSTRALAKRFGRVVGVDADATLIERAKAYSTFSDDPDLASRVSYEHTSDLAKWDAYGERFDFVFSAYTLAYLENITDALRQWGGMLKPGGTLAVLEIQGLFAIHHPLQGSRSWFERFDKDVLKSFGYNSSAGVLMNEALNNVPDLRKVAYLDWNDPELSFNGPLASGSPVHLGWEERWKRLWPLMNQAGVEEGLHESFFNCLASPDHRCDKPVKLLIATKVSGTSPKPMVARLNDADTKEDEGRLDSFYPGESGGGGGDE